MPHPSLHRIVLRVAVVATLTLGLLALPAASALAQPAQTPATTTATTKTFSVGEIQKMLDQKVRPMTVRNGQLLKVLADIESAADSSGRWLEVPARTLGCLPYGDKTPIAFNTTGNQTGRELLATLLDAANLTWQIDETGEGKAMLRVLPRPELVRIGRRATIDEVELLRVLRHETVKANKTSLKAQIQAAAQRHVDFLYDVTGEDAAQASKDINDSAANMPESPFTGVLDQVCAEHRWAWRVDQSTICVVDRPKQIIHQLQRTVVVQWKSAPLDEALVELGEASGVLVQFQPAMMEGVEEQNQRITSMDTSRRTILQTIETVSARTGLAYEVREDSLYFFAPRLHSGRIDPVIGMYQMPLTGGGSVNLFLRKSMLPEDVQPLVDKRLEKAAAEMADQLRKSAADAPPTANP
ncbi:MAG: hypothetical protein BIFFINMI_01220 [Phycisphaerae bacterium]|nr:hypothetical protein [Phycisphaerae bacterium]